MPRARRRRLQRQRKKHGIVPSWKKLHPADQVVAQIMRGAQKRLESYFVDLMTRPPVFDPTLVGAKLSRRDRRKLARVAERTAAR